MQNVFKKVLNEHNFNATMTVQMSHKYLVKMSGAWKHDFKFQPFVQLVRCGRYKMTQIVSSYTIRRYVYHLVNYLSKKVLSLASNSQAKYYYSSQAAHAKDEGSVYDLTLDEKNPYMSKENAIGLSNNLHHYCTTIVGILTGKVVTYCARSKTFPVYL